MTEPATLMPRVNFPIQPEDSLPFPGRRASSADATPNPALALPARSIPKST